MPLLLEKYQCGNEEKFNRAVFGTTGRGGGLVGGVGENATEEAKLAEYDRLGGLILEGKMKVETGSFFDFTKNKPREKPVIVYAFRDDEGKISVPEGTELPLEARPDVGKTPKKKKSKE